MRTSLTVLMLCLACGPGGGGPSGEQHPENPAPTEKAKVAVTPVGVPIGGEVKVKVPVSGGTVTSADQGFSIVVPAGALAAEQTLSIMPITNNLPGAVATAYRLGPEGQTFTAPVKLVWHYTDDELAGSAPAALRVAFQTAGGKWSKVPVTVDATAHTLTAETTHFSDWAWHTEYRLDPPFSSISTGKWALLQLVYCPSEDADIWTCVPDAFTIDEWAVNGVAGGNGTLGTIVDGAPYGWYHAPATEPMPSWVTVSAAINDFGSGKLLVTAIVNVSEHPPLTGTISGRQVTSIDNGGVYSTNATVRFKWSVDDNQYVVSSGMVVAHHDQVMPGGANCEIHTSFSANIAEIEGAILFQDTAYFPFGMTSGMFTGTSTCNGTLSPQPLTVFDNARWWPAPESKSFTADAKGRLRETLIGVTAGGSNTNVSWSLVPTF